MPTIKNKAKADVLTHVPKHRLRSAKSHSADAVSQACAKNCKVVESTLRRHHYGVNSTLYFSRKNDPSILRAKTRTQCEKSISDSKFE